MKKNNKDGIEKLMANILWGFVASVPGGQCVCLGLVIRVTAQGHACS